MNEMKYTEIFKLKEMLEKANIPFEFRGLFDGFQICYPTLSERVCSVIVHLESYGHEQDLIEIMGLLTANEKECDDVVGYLSAEDVFNRIKHHWELAE